jgi:hypothetical protein
VTPIEDFFERLYPVERDSDRDELSDEREISDYYYAQYLAKARRVEQYGNTMRLENRRN